MVVQPSTKIENIFKIYAIMLKIFGCNANGISLLHGMESHHVMGLLGQLKESTSFF